MNLLRVFVGSMIVVGGVVAAVNNDWGNLAWVACTAIWWRTACGYEDACEELRKTLDEY